MQRLHRYLRVRRPAAAAVPLLFLAACGTAPAPLASSHGAPAHRAAAHPAAARAAHPSTAHAHLAADQARHASTTAGTGHAKAAAVPSTTVPGAPGCPMLPADNVWNTDISQLPVNPHSAGWMRSMDSAGTNLHPDFGPNGGGYPFGIPYTIVSSSHPMVRVAFSDRPESDKGPYPLGADTRIEGGKSAGGDRHAIMVNSQTCKLYELF
ncbi:MAG: hypothetical protein ABJB47_24280, partial [Actinomycetota bacterium]